VRDLEAYGERFEGLLRVNGYSPKTVYHYRYEARRFFGHLRECGVEDLVQVSPSHVRDYMAELYGKAMEEGKPSAAHGQNRALQAVKAMFRLLEGEGYLASDPTRHVAYARRPKRLPPGGLTRAEAERLLETPDTSTVIGYRDRAILEVLYSTGLRRSEVESLKVGDVDLKEGFVRVNLGKGGKDRVVPLGEVACRYVEGYLKAIRPQLVKDEAQDILFLSQYGNRLANGVLWRMVSLYGAKAGLKRKVYPHLLRHTCATLMMKNKANLRHIQEMLGHESLGTTQVYLSVTAADLKAAHRKYHPRERMKSD